MKAKPTQQDQPFDAERFRLALARKLDRLVAEAIEGWSTCENTRCRRAKRCASQDRACIAKWQNSRPPLSPEQVEAGVHDLRMALEARKRLGEGNVTVEQLADAIRKEKAARRAAMPPQDGDLAVPVVEHTELAPDKQAQIDRTWNEYAASSPEDDRKRAPGPRITQL